MRCSNHRGHTKDIDLGDGRRAQAGFIAQKRLARGLQLSQAEAVALIASQLQERMRDGTHSFYELTNLGREMLGRRHVLPGVSVLLKEIQVEGTLNDGYVFSLYPCAHERILR